MFCILHYISDVWDVWRNCCLYTVRYHYTNYCSRNDICSHGVCKHRIIFLKKVSKYITHMKKINFNNRAQFFSKRLRDAYAFNDFMYHYSPHHPVPLGTANIEIKNSIILPFYSFIPIILNIKDFSQLTNHEFHLVCIYSLYCSS